MDKYFYTVLSVKGVSEVNIKSKKRDAKTAYARALFSYLALEYGNLTYTAIGNILNRDHSTIISSVKKFKERIDIYKDIQQDIEQCLNIISETEITRSIEVSPRKPVVRNSVIVAKISFSPKEITDYIKRKGMSLVNSKQEMPVKTYQGRVDWIEQYRAAVEMPDGSLKDAEEYFEECIKQKLLEI